MDLRKREDVDRQCGICIFHVSRWQRTPNCSSGPLRAQSAAARGHISTPGQASKTTICSGSRGLRQCAEALDGVSGVSTGKRYRRGETPLSAHYSNPADRDATVRPWSEVPGSREPGKGGLPPGTGPR
jgi:hypothetical protein